MTRKEIISALEDVLIEDKYDPVSQRGIDAIQAAIDMLKKVENGVPLEILNVGFDNGYVAGILDLASEYDIDETDVLIKLKTHCKGFDVEHLIEPFRSYVIKYWNEHGLGCDGDDCKHYSVCLSILKEVDEDA